MNNTTSGDKVHHKYRAYQPVSISVVDRLLKDNNNVGAEYHHLNDNWDREEYDNREKVIDNLVEAIHWISDGNSDFIRKKLKGSEILKEWEGGMEEINILIKKWDVKNKGRHYSCYNNDNDDDNDDGENDTGSVTQNHRDRSNPIGERKGDPDKNKLLKHV